MKRQLFFKNLVVFLCLMLIPVFILGELAIFITSNYAAKGIESQNQMIYDTGIKSVESTLAEIESISLNLSMRPSISTKIMNAFNNPFRELPSQDYQLVSTIIDMLFAVSNSNKYINSIYFYIPNESMYFINSTSGIQEIPYFFDNEWYDTYLDMDENEDILLKARDIRNNGFETSRTQVLSIFRRLSSSSRFPNGILVLNINSVKINAIFNQIAATKTTTCFVMDEDENIIFCNDAMPKYNKDILKKIAEGPEGRFRSTILDKSMIINKKQSLNYPSWQYVSIMKQEELYLLPRTINIITIILTVICLLVSMLLAYNMMKKNYQYLQNVLAIIDAAHQGKPLPDFEKERSNIYGYILQNIVKTFVSNNSLSIQLAEKNYRLQTLEFMAFRSQIKPHFLYNTLEAIKWITIGLTNGPNAATYMMENLSKILRYSFTDTQTYVDLEKEIEIIKCYFNIQRKRCDKIKAVVWNVDKTLCNAKIIKFLIQPIVENCFQHGLDNAKKSLSIKIHIFKKNGNLIIHIVDTGIGLSWEKLQSVRADIAEQEVQNRHIGLANTNQRIKIIYGNEYGISIYSKRGIGTLVCIKLPIQYEL